MNRKNLLLGGILVVLLIIAYIYQGPYQEWQQSGEKGEDLLSNIKTVEEVAGVEIQQNATTTFALEKEEKGWKLGKSKEFYIKDSNEEDLEEALNSLFQNEWEVVSTDPDNKEEFQTGDTGTQFTLSTDTGGEDPLIVGKTGPGLQSSYLSFPDSSKTYLVDSDISDLTGIEQWGDPVIFDADKEDFSELRFQYPDSEFTVIKDGEQWRGTTPYNFSVDQEKINKVIEVMTDLTATDIPKQTFEGTGLAKHLIIVEASGEKKTNTLMVGESNKEGLYYAKKAKSDNIYLITEEQRNKLKRSISDLR